MPTGMGSQAVSRSCILSEMPLTGGIAFLNIRSRNKTLEKQEWHATQQEEINSKEREAIYVLKSFKLL